MSVSGAGDVNGDGIDDFIIGSSSFLYGKYGSGSGSEHAYVVFGTANGFGRA
ncbi:MAG: hypothetical protein O2912_10740 [Proteobacteria bacterium]|nr:hypothetical protein [Pseudomonadota bacterium]